MKINFTLEMLMTKGFYYYYSNYRLGKLSVVMPSWHIQFWWLFNEAMKEIFIDITMFALLFAALCSIKLKLLFSSHEPSQINAFIIWKTLKDYVSNMHRFDIKENKILF